MTKLLPRRDVEAITRLPVSTLYKKMREGKFPRPVRVGEGERAPVMWREDEVQEYIAELTEKRGEAYRKGPVETAVSAIKPQSRNSKVRAVESVNSSLANEVTA